MHVRTKVRNAVDAALKTLPIFEGRVFKSRVYEIPRDQMPCAVIFSEPETIEPIVKGQSQPRNIKRHVRTQVFVFTKAADNIEDAIDDVAELVENKIFEDPTLGKLAIETNLEDTSLHITGGPSTLVGVAVLSFVSIVQTKEGKSDTSIRNQ